MTENNPTNLSPKVPDQPDPSGQLQLIRQLSALEHDAVMAAIEAARAEIRAEFASLRARLLGTSAWALGDEVRRRNAEEKVDELRDRLESATKEMPAQNRQLKEMRSVLNDAHRLIHAVSKSLEKRPS